MAQIILNDKQPGKIILNGIVYGGNSTEDVPIADIYNHGDIVGLNPLYYGIQRGNSGYKFTNSNNEYIFINGGYRSDNMSLTFLPPIKNTKYSTVCFDMEIVSGYDGAYTQANLGAIKALFTSNTNVLDIPGSVTLDQYGSTTSESQRVTSKTLIQYSTQYNIDGNNPWYVLPRKVQTISIPTDEEFYYYIYMFTGFCQVKYYSIWLEP